MPIYEYTCDPCGRRFERLVLASTGAAAEIITCRHCGSDEVTRVLSTFAAHSGAPSRGRPKAEPSGGGGGCGRPGGCGCH